MDINKEKFNFNLILSCPKCFNIPTINIINKQFSLKCQCGYTDYYSLIDHQAIINNIYFNSRISKILNKEKCGICGNCISSIQKKSACSICESLFCEKCYENHEHYFINQCNINNTCRKHMKKYFGYCHTCKENICPIFNDHVNHSFVLFQKLYMNDKDIEGYLIDQQTIIKDKLKEFENIYNSTIKDIELVYNNIKKKLENELKLKEIIINDYIKYNKNNFYSVANVNNMIKNKSLDIVENKSDIFNEYYIKILEKIKDNFQILNGNNINLGQINNDNDIPKILSDNELTTQENDIINSNNNILIKLENNDKKGKLRVINNIYNELNYSNCDMYVNGKKCNYSKEININENIGKIVTVKLVCSKIPISISKMFYCCKNISEIEFNNTEGIKYMESAFEGCENLRRITWNGLKNTKIEKLSSMFKLCKNLQEIDLSCLTFNNSINLSFIFFCCSSLSKIDLSNINFNMVKSLVCAFMGCSNLNDILFSHDDTIWEDYIEVDDEENDDNNGLDSNNNNSNISNNNKIEKNNKDSNNNINNIDNNSSIFNDFIYVEKDEKNNIKQDFYYNIDFSGAKNNKERYAGKSIYDNDDSFSNDNIDNLYDKKKSQEPLDYIKRDNSQNKNINNIYANNYPNIEIDCMFNGCSNLKYIDLSIFGTQLKVGKLINIFLGCKNIIGININNIEMMNNTYKDEIRLLFDKFPTLKCLIYKNKVYNRKTIYKTLYNINNIKERGSSIFYDGSIN